VQGYYGRDHACFTQYHQQSRNAADYEKWLERWVLGVEGRKAYMELVGAQRAEELGVKEHAYSAGADFGY
jgi:glutaconate CoA-transferase subunit A